MRAPFRVGGLLARTILAFCLVLLPAVLQAEWQILRNCRLLPNESNDADSFHISHEGREYVFRLYMVDAPETDDSFPERVAEQATHFGTGVEQTIWAGNFAKDYVAKTLNKLPFDVVTRWQDAMGRSSLGRYYAFIFLDLGDSNGKKDTDLAVVLLHYGLARTHGVRVAPSFIGYSASELEKFYRGVEAGARERKEGIWSEAERARQRENEAREDESSSAPAPTPTPAERTQPKSRMSMSVETSIRTMNEVFARRYPEKYGYAIDDAPANGARSSRKPSQTETDQAETEKTVANTEVQRENLKRLRERVEISRSLVRSINNIIRSNEKWRMELRKEQVNAEGSELQRILARIREITEATEVKRKELEVAEADLQEATATLSEALGN